MISQQDENKMFCQNASETRLINNYIYDCFEKASILIPPIQSIGMLKCVCARTDKCCCISFWYILVVIFLKMHAHWTPCCSETHIILLMTLFHNLCNLCTPKKIDKLLKSIIRLSIIYYCLNIEFSSIFFVLKAFFALFKNKSLSIFSYTRWI